MYGDEAYPGLSPAPPTKSSYSKETQIMTSYTRKLFRSISVNLVLYAATLGLFLLIPAITGKDIVPAIVAAVLITAATIAGVFIVKTKTRPKTSPATTPELKNK